jgi:predicted ATP-dependent protease
VNEQASRLVDDATKISIQLRTIGDLLREADYFAAENGHETITCVDVQQAIDAQIHRADRLRERIYEEIQRGTLLIDTAIARAGQVNGLVVSTLGNFSFGRPVRITAGIRLGRGEVVDIEREVAFGGPIHAKGVLILAGFLGARFAATGHSRCTPAWCSSSRMGRWRVTAPRRRSSTPCSRPLPRFRSNRRSQ